MKNFQYVQAPNLKAAIALLQEPETEALAGGTDLLGELKRRIRETQRLVNLKTLEDLRQIRLGKDLRLGSLVTLAEVETHPAIGGTFPVLKEAATLAASLQLRNMGTVGGNLCQHPRCWYFRSSRFPCWLKGGKKCFAVDGQNQYHAILGRGMCQAVHPSDLAPALVCLGARVKVAGPGGKRALPLEELYAKPEPLRRQMTLLQPGELVTEITVPLPAKGSRSAYFKAMERKAWSFALTSVAAQVQIAGEVIEDGRIVLGSVAPGPWRAKGAEEILRGQKFSEELVRRTGEAAVAGAKPLRDNAYKVFLVKGLVEKALRSLSRTILPGR
jgi:xanthine dehydrogenase YagS FAD-binding subunit